MPASYTIYKQEFTIFFSTWSKSNGSIENIVTLITLSQKRRVSNKRPESLYYSTETIYCIAEETIIQFHWRTWHHNREFRTYDVNLRYKHFWQWSPTELSTETICKRFMISENTYFLKHHLIGFWSTFIHHIRHFIHELFPAHCSVDGIENFKDVGPAKIKHESLTQKRLSWRFPNC